MKKKSKLIFKVNRNRTAKLYINGKWQKYITKLDIHAEPLDYTIEFDRHLVNKKGRPIIENDELVKETKKYKI